MKEKRHHLGPSPFGKGNIRHHADFVLLSFYGHITTKVVGFALNFDLIVKKLFLFGQNKKLDLGKLALSVGDSVM